MASGASSSAGSQPAGDPAAIFKARLLKGKMLAALQQDRQKRGEDTVTGPVIPAEDLRTALSDALGTAVPSKNLFSLMQMADPDSEGVVTMPRFLEVVALRREQMETERRQAQLAAAYQALGGNADKDIKVKSDLLMAITSDFAGKEAATAGLAGVVAHKRKGGEELLAMGGQLDSEDEEDLKDTSKVEFNELESFAGGLREHGLRRGADVGGDDGDVDGEGGSGTLLR